MTDYLAAFLESPRDLKHYGRKGMKWGQRIFTKGGGDKSAGGKTEAAPVKAAAPEPAKRPGGNIQDNVESSAARYYRLSEQARAGGASQMTEQDLKFFNARTDALAKINKMNETQPSWLRETATKVVQQSAQRQMQTIADAMADRYVGDPIKNALKGAVEVSAATKAASASSKSKITAKKTDSDDDAPAVKTKTTDTKVSLSDRAKAAASKAADSVAESKRAKGDKQYEDTQKKIADIDARKASDPSLLNVTESVRYYKDNPSNNPIPPAGLSPNGYRLWLEEIKRS